jgi:hypothetical protein
MSQISLIAVNGRYVCAEGGGGQNVIANRDENAESTPK